MNAPTAAAHLLPQIQLRDVPQALIDALQARFGAQCSLPHKPVRVSVNWISHRLWLKRFAASAMKNRSARCSAKGQTFAAST